MAEEITQEKLDAALRAVSRYAKKEIGLNKLFDAMSPEIGEHLLRWGWPTSSFHEKCRAVINFDLPRLLQ